MVLCYWVGYRTHRRSLPIFCFGLGVVTVPEQSPFLTVMSSIAKSPWNPAPRSASMMICSESYTIDHSSTQMKF